MALQPRQVESGGGESPFAVGDYIQLACMGNHSVRLDVRADGLSGSILINEGRLWFATYGQQEGLDALRTMLGVHAADVRPTSHDETPALRNLPDRSFEHTLLDLAREADEADLSQTDPFDLADAFGELDDAEEISPAESSSPEPAAPRLRVVTPPDAEPTAPTLRTFDQLVDEATDALLTKDYPSALESYEAALALRPSDGIARANVERLRALLDRAE